MTIQAVYIWNTISESWDNASDNVASFEINHQGGYCLEASVNFKGIDFFQACNPSENMAVLRLKISVGDTDYFFLIEERNETITVPGIDFQIWGRSKQALLGPKFSKTISDTSTSEPSCGPGYESYCYDEAACVAAGGAWDEELGWCVFPPEMPVAEAHPWQGSDCPVSDVLASIPYYCPYNIVINWDVEDYTLKAGTLSVNNQYPIDLIASLAEAIGAEVFGEIDGSLTIREYKIAPGETEEPVATYTDIDDIFSLSGRVEANTGYNAVTIIGYSDADELGTEIKNAYLGIEKIGDAAIVPGVAHTVRAWIFYPAGITEAQIGTYIDDENISSIYQYVWNWTNVTETVALSYGQGNTSMPDENGDTFVDEPKDYGKMFSEKEVTYKTFYRDFDITTDAPGNYRIGFYFLDGSADTIYSYTVEEESDGNAANGAYLSAVRLDDGPIIPGQEVPVRIYWYHPTLDSGAIVTDTDTGDNITFTPGSAGIETKNETVLMAYGIGNTSQPDTTGNTSVSDPLLVDDPHESKTVDYDINYKDYTIRSNDLGDHVAVFAFSDKSVQTQFGFSVSAPQEAYKDSVSLSIERLSEDGPVEPSAWLQIRLWFYHSDGAGTKFSTYLPPGESISVSPSAAETASKTETVSLQWGRGNQSTPDTDGKSEVDIPADYGKPVSSTDVTYTAFKKDYSISSSVIGSHTLYFYINDKSAQVQFSFEVAEAAPTHRDYTIRVKKKGVEQYVAGAFVYLDEVYRGSTDPDGYITLSNVQIGATYPLRITASGMQDTDKDDLSNDFLTIPE